MPAGIKSSLLVSFCGSGMMTITYWAILIIRKKPGDNTPVNKMAGICFLICFAVIFVIYFLCGYLTARREKKNLEKYLDD